jgi:hypothetical protein
MRIAKDMNTNVEDNVECGPDSEAFHHDAIHCKTCNGVGYYYREYHDPKMVVPVRCLDCDAGKLSIYE